MNKRLFGFFTAVLLATLAEQAVLAQDKKQAAARFINQMKSARVIELNFVWDRNSPLLGLNPPFTLGLQTSHKQTKGMIPGGIAFAADMMFFSGQHGSPNVDALGHISDNGKHFNGADAMANEGAAGLATLGIEAYPKERFIN